MSEEWIDCPLCGHRYAVRSHAGCVSCPVGAGCGTLCCPACGYTTIDASRSVLVRLGRIFRGKSNLENPPHDAHRHASR